MTQVAKMTVDNDGKSVSVEGIADGKYLLSVTDEGRILLKPSNGGDKNLTVIRDGKVDDNSLIFCLAGGEYSEVDFIKIDETYYQVMPKDE